MWAAEHRFRRPFIRPGLRRPTNRGENRRLALRVLILLLALIPATATAGIRAVYTSGWGSNDIIEIADNGDMRIESNSGLDLVVRDGELYTIENRLTGPIVTRGEDLFAVLRERARNIAPWKDEPGTELTIVSEGSTIVNGRRGTPYFMRYGHHPREAQPIVVMSDDPALKPLGRAMGLVLRIRMERGATKADDGSRSSQSIFRAMVALVEAGGPLAVSDDELRSFETVPIAPERFTLPAEPETREALRARLEEEAKADDAPPEVRPEDVTSGAIFDQGRLWLWNDFGTLSSIAEDETVRRRERPGGFVLSLCAASEGPLALTANGEEGKVWTLHTYRAGGWRAGRTVKRAKDEKLVAMSCLPEGALLITSHRLILAGPGGPSVVPLATPLHPALVKPSVHVTADHVYLGINAGEWGGGLRRIGRRDGRIATLERNATGALCGGPLNTNCDAVNGITDIPWKPGCVAVAVGLIHLAPHGRIVEICGDTIETMFAKTSDGRVLDGPGARGQTDDGPSIAFFGLVRIGDSLLAAGHDGIYRFQAAGPHAFQPLPRFREVDGVLVSFAIPDAVLVITMINQRASMSGAAPIIVAR
jgi:hypothetical protein